MRLAAGGGVGGSETRPATAVCGLDGSENKQLTSQDGTKQNNPKRGRVCTQTGKSAVD